MTAYESELITDDPLVQLMNKYCPNGYLVDRRYKETGCLLSDRYIEFEEKILNFEVREDDIWVLSFPKCGTTWTQEMVWLLANNFNFEEARKVKLDERLIFLEFSSLSKDFPQDFIERLNNMKSPRFIKSHLPLGLLPKQLLTVKPKIVYVYRDPKDAAISFFHHYRMWHLFSGSLQEFVGAFLDDKVLFSPFWGNVIPFWEMRDEPNILFITYEDMKKDLFSVAKRTADFLGVEIPEESKDAFLKHLSFGEMKNNPSVNYGEYLAKKNLDVSFIREGKAGGWRELLDPEVVKKFDEKAMEAMKGSGFPYYKFS